MTKAKSKRPKLVEKHTAADAADLPSKTQVKLKKKKAKTKKPENSDSNGETIESLLEPFSKEQLISLVIDLSLNHDSLFSLIKSTADQDVSHRKIFVYGIGWDATRQDVESAFASYGEIEALNVVMDRNTGKCKGYAFIIFKDRKSAKQLLKNPRVQVGNRVTTCQLASEGPVAPSTGAGGIVSQQVFTSDFPQRKIYVSNVPANADVDRLRAFFEVFGEIENGPKGFDPVTRRFKGYAIFVFKTVEGAKKVLEQPFKLFDGNQLHCQKATENSSKAAVGTASITTVMQPLQPQMFAAIAAAQQAQNIAFLGQQTGIINPMYVPNANLGALMGGYYGMVGEQVQGLGAYGASSSGEAGSSSSMRQGMPFVYPSGHTPTTLAKGTGPVGSYYPSSL